MSKLAKYINIPSITTDGTLCPMQYPDHIPFKIERVYFIYGVSEGAVRGAHTHRENKQILFCIQSSIDIILDNGLRKESVHLDIPSKGLILEPGIWHEMANFKKDTIILVLASKRHEENDYVRSYQDFLEAYANHHK